MFKAIPISENVYWVGAIDWNERVFDGHPIDHGTSYNAYLIMDESITLIDTVKITLVDEMLERIRDVVDPAQIQYVVSNHGELDHSGSLPTIMELAPSAKVVTSKPKGQEILTAHFGDQYDYVAVTTGDTLNIGKRTLSFTATPMVHWPDNMVTYSDADKILFSNDAFGQHLADTGRFDDQVDLSLALDEAKRYYANIVMPFSKNVQRIMPAVKALDLQMIAPSHGVIWRENPQLIVDKYSEWCLGRPQNKAVVVYDSMYGTTEKMALRLTQTFESHGVDTSLLCLRVNDLSSVMTAVMDAKYLAVGSPTVNRSMLPTVAAFMEFMKGLMPGTDPRIGISFGSYGWVKSAQDEITEILTKAKFELPCEQFSHQWAIDEAGLDEIDAAVSQMLDAQ